jgi:hypothetical protein
MTNNSGKGSKTAALIVAAFVGLLFGAIGVIAPNPVFAILGTVIVALVCMNLIMNHFRKPQNQITR